MSEDDPRHGTEAGYVAHRRAGEDACRPCKDAASAGAKARYRARHPQKNQTRAACGTDGGYYRHRRGREGEPPSVPCRACCEAHSAANRERVGAQPRNYRPKPVSKEPRWTQRGLIKVAAA